MSPEVTALVEQGCAARRDGDPEGARERFVSAVACGRAEGDTRSLVRALRGVAQIDRDQGRYADALPPSIEAVRLCRDLDRPLLLAHTVRHLGDLYQDLDHADLAEPCYREALALYRAHPEASQLDLANAIRPMAILEDGRGETEKAAKLWREARALYGAAGVREGVIECELRLGARTPGLASG